MRIASLLPATTEIVVGLGLRDHLVGISHECDFPPDLDLPPLTSDRLHAPRRFDAIDTEVRELVENALALYLVDTDALRKAAPDLILTQDLCQVCAVSKDDVRSAVAELGLQTRIVSTQPLTMGQVFEAIRTIAAALAADPRTLLNSLQGRLQALRNSAPAERPTVLSLEWIDPVMIGGLWMPELIEAAGGRAIGVATGEHAPTWSGEQLAGVNPDVVVVKPCGFDLAQTRANEDAIRRALPTAWHDRTWLADGNALFNRPGPRLVDSAEVLAAILHPHAFPQLAHAHAHWFERL